MRSAYRLLLRRTSVATVLASVLCAVIFGVGDTAYAGTAAKGSAAAGSLGMGSIRGVVRDQAGGPIPRAMVALFRVGTTELIKQAVTSADGSFLIRIIPGRYTLLAVAEGFNPISLRSIEVGRSSDLNYGFDLQRAGSGNTLPEKRIDRNSAKWRIRAAAIQRSIYQNQEGNVPVESAPEQVAAKQATVRPTGAVETYFASTSRGGYVGTNFAVSTQVARSAELIFSGQIGRGAAAPQRFQVDARLKAGSRHDIRLSASAAKIRRSRPGSGPNSLEQFTVQAADEWKVREGLVLLYGIDYSTLGGGDSSITPRLGIQFDIDPRTRLRAGYSTQSEEKSWANAIELEGTSVGFAEPVAVEDLPVVRGKSAPNRSSRIEMGIERILDGRSSVESTVFFDTTPGRGVGLTAIPFEFIAGDAAEETTAVQQGGAAGARIVYFRRINSVLSASGGYSAGTGQRLSQKAISDPSTIFEQGIFQTFYGEVTADLESGTRVRTIFRFSPDATVFAIDPFKGRLAIYDPGLSILVTQRLPRFGLPIRAQAILDGRNLLDAVGGVSSSDGRLIIEGHRRMLRGGIMVRF
ncbi:MAG: carboxypeptidase regulatory-like domain-containing protein [Acidobacteria bacterium]|nr:carboxypeptidase regulatory-like domain-containing protein [Acidobacteriota bacterium]MCW5950158.1 carboxypeptidase regulatory-like domain-containing protein [Pyrinomonadaceae bacterium]